MHDAKILPLSFVTCLRRPFSEIVQQVSICKLQSLLFASRGVSAEMGLKALIYLPQRQLNSGHQDKGNVTEVNHESLLSAPSV